MTYEEKFAKEYLGKRQFYNMECPYCKVHLERPVGLPKEYGESFFYCPKCKRQYDTVSCHEFKKKVVQIFPFGYEHYWNSLTEEEKELNRKLGFVEEA
mgnify:CR=1 FL=1